MARLLGPADFGVFIGVTSFTSIFLFAAQFGFPQAILQAKVLTASQINSAFWVISTLALLLLGFCILIAEPLALFFDSDQYALVMYLMCAVFLLTPFSSVGLALLRRDMRFDQVALIEIVALTASALISIGAAILGAGVYSLVAGAISSMVVSVSMLWKALSWRPRSPHWLAAKGLFRYSSYTTANVFLGSATNRFDNVLVGGMLGTSELGLYNRAYSLARIPSDQFAGSVGPLVFGSLSRIQDDVKWSRSLYFKATSAISIVTMPFLVLLFVAGPIAIEFLYGEEWMAASDPLRVMVIGAVFVMLTTTLRGFVNAQGFVRQFVPINFICLIFTLVAVLFFAKWGLAAIALGISARELLLFVLIVRLLGRSRIQLAFSEITYAIAPAILSAAIALLGGFAMLAHLATLGLDNSFLSLLVLSILVFFSYGLTVILLMWLWPAHGPLTTTRDLIKGVLSKIWQRVIPQLKPM